MELAWGQGYRRPLTRLDILVFIDGRPQRLMVEEGVNQFDWPAKNKGYVSFGGHEVWFLTKEVKNIN